jgi:hypothetical protein
MEITPRIHKFILRAILKDGTSVTKEVMQRFGVSRPTALRWMQLLIDEGLVDAMGNTRARHYRLRSLFSVNESFALSEDLAEDRIWRSKVAPHVGRYGKTAIDVAAYAFTEMVNNAIEHSEAESLFILGGGNACELEFRIVDDGVGIFSKIKNHYNLEDERHAVLELSKGKLTTDPAHHTGQGIFFSSRACRAFAIRSGTHLFKRLEARSDWILDVSASQLGTSIAFRVDAMNPRPIKRVFDKYSNEADLGFVKTHIPVHLLRYKDEGLVSRSQAKRLLARFDRFQEVHLDFKGVDEIGQAFADEIFRVFQSQHPDVTLYWANTTAAVSEMIERALGEGRRIEKWVDSVDEQQDDPDDKWHLE